MAPIVRMAEDARRIILATDPSAQLILPPVTTPLGPSVPQERGATDWLTAYLQAGGAKFADTFGVHGYTQAKPCADPCPASAVLPEGAALMMGYVRSLTTLPVFITETGLSGAQPSLPNAALDAAWSARYYLIAMSYGAARLYWFGWDMGPEDFFDEPSRALLPDATVYGTVHSWGLGATFAKPCESQGGSIWACDMTLANGRGARAVWDTAQTCIGTTTAVCGTSTQSVPAMFTHYQDVFGVDHPIVEANVQLGPQPALLETD